jgi:hypothetical protein
MAKTGTTQNRRLVICECPNHTTDDQGMTVLPKKCLWSVGAGERSRTPIKCLQNTRSCPLSYTGMASKAFLLVPCQFFHMMTTNNIHGTPCRTRTHTITASKAAALPLR